MVRSGSKREPDNIISNSIINSRNDSHREPLHLLVADVSHSISTPLPLRVLQDCRRGPILTTCSTKVMAEANTAC